MTQKSWNYKFGSINNDFWLLLCTRRNVMCWRYKEHTWTWNEQGRKNTSVRVSSSPSQWVTLQWEAETPVSWRQRRERGRPQELPEEAPSGRLWNQLWDQPSEKVCLSHAGGTIWRGAEHLGQAVVFSGFKRSVNSVNKMLGFCFNKDMWLGIQDVPVKELEI